MKTPDDPSFSHPRPTLEEALEQVGVRAAHIRAAALRSHQTSEPLAIALRQQGLATSDQIARAEAEVEGLEYHTFSELMAMDLRKVAHIPVTGPLRGLPIALAEDGTLTIAVSSREAEVDEELQASYQLQYSIASTRALQHLYRRVFAKTADAYRAIAAAIATKEREKRMETGEADYPKLLIALLRHACYIGANDLQLHNSNGVGNIKMVVDGVGQLFDVVSTDTLDRLITVASRFTGKNEDNIMKDIFGEASFRETGVDASVLEREFGELQAEFDFRLNFGKPKEGRTLVIRFLARDTESLDFDQLGIDTNDQATLLKALNSNSGLIVITGPTGSSKTTTRFAMLSQIDPEERSVQTIENPVEYRHPLWLQYEIRNVNEDEGTDQVFRGMLRNAPRVIDIAEVRTPAVASTMMRAAATGHLVFTTLHADDAPLAVYMLRKLEVDNADLAANLQIVIGVRLSRRLCIACRIEDMRPSTEEFMRELTKETTIEATGVRVFRANEAGCEHCNAGYRNRFLIYELMEVEEKLAGLLREGAEAARIKAEGIAPDRTLRARGFRALLDGRTSADELIRILPRHRY